MSLSDPQPGGIAFYASKNTFIDKAITLRTGSKIVHVAILDSPTTTIAATSGGITRQDIADPVTIFSPITPYPPQRLQEGLDFLAGEVGKAYGYADLVNQMLLLTNKDPILLDKSSDCSVLATRFLWIAGYALPASFIYPEKATPGGLYYTLTGWKD